MQNNYRKTLKYSDTWKIAVIILKFEQLSFTTEKYVQKLSLLYGRAT